MLIDGLGIADGAVLEADICVIGSGPAGIALMRRLEAAGRDVLVVEAGGTRPTAEAQRLAAGEDDGLDYPFSEARVHAFGGTSHLWKGLCCPPDADDRYATAPGGAEAWSDVREALAPYFPQAMRFFGVELADVEEAASKLMPVAGFSFKPGVVARELRVGPRHLEHARQSERIRVLLNARATALVPNAGRDGIARIDVVVGKRRVQIEASEVVLATGAIEASRLLLESEERAGSRFVNAHDQVGRCLMERHQVTFGALEPADEAAIPEPWAGEPPMPGGGFAVVMTLPPALREREDLLGCWMRAYRVSAARGTASVEAVRALAYAFLTRQRPLNVGQLLLEASKAPFAVARYALEHFGLVRRGSTTDILLAANVEQAPDPENRIALGKGRDMHGCRLPRLIWAESERDRRSREENVRLATRGLEDAGLGRVVPVAERPRLLEAKPDKVCYHHAGGTRIADDARHGVVDRHCRVHGLRNLWIASSAVFPAAGAANPTVTIVSLAMRLADRLTATAPEEGKRKRALSEIVE
ncbi:MAG: GMC family oxidoreductase [Pseudomonadota bacterium]